MVYSYRDKQKLEKLDHKLEKRWKKIYKLIMNRFNIVIEAKSKDRKLIKMFDKFNKIEHRSLDDVIDAYYELNDYISDLTFTPKYKKLLKENLESINQEKIDYNNDALKITNLVKMIPINILAKIFGYKKWVYFRNED